MKQVKDDAITMKGHSTATYPADWPGEGPIDLAIHDLPHHSSTTEWWYMNSHFNTKDGRNFSIFASFFRKVIDYDKKTKELVYAHSMIWALYDASNKEYHPFSLVDKRAPELGKKKLEKGELVKDDRLRRAALEVVNKGKVPQPDRLFKDDVVVAPDRLYLNFDGNTYEKKPDGSYELHLEERDPAISCKLTFKPKKAPIRHGDNGVVRGVSAEDMFYYFIPRCEVTGTLFLQGEELELVKSSGWYDHEFGRHPEKSDEEHEDQNEDTLKDVAWNWLSTQLDNGCEVSAYDLFDDDGEGELCGHWLIFIDEQGNRHAYENFTLEPLGGYTSTRTFNIYPTGWKLTVPELDLELHAEAAIEQQEFITFISRPAFWEGRINVVGKLKGKDVKGPGFVERSGFYKIDDLDDFFKAVSRETLKSVQKILPLNPTGDKAAELISGREHAYLLEGLDLQRYSDYLIKPIREIIDRGGKSWRSYAPLACCDLVGGNSQKTIDWMALPELMHTGSLIVDDVEDKSEIRRGKESCHKMYGEATAINAGTACYFISQVCIYADELDESKKLEIYNYYFQGLRAAHTGQALDIAGLHYMMPEIVESGDGDLLEKRVLGIHRLKSAVPASFLARMGTTLAGGTKEQVEELKNYFESLGLAFQIVDDTLNLKGFRDNLKSKGEDITHGKITYPVAKAMKLLKTKEERQQLWDIVKSKPKDPAVIGRAVTIIHDCGALDEADNEAKEMMEAAWKRLDPLVDDSLVKIMLRAFSWYLLERHY